MKKSLSAVLAVGLIGTAAVLAAGEGGNDGITGKDARATLAARAGEYRLTVKFWPVPDGEPQVSTLDTRRRMILKGRVLQSEVGPDGSGFEGTGMTGFDEATGRFWYVWTDTSSGGVSVLEGTLHDRGGTLEGTQSTPRGPSPLRVEIRREGSREVHDYWVPGEDGRTVRSLELTFVPAG